MVWKILGKNGQRMQILHQSMIHEWEKNIQNPNPYLGAFYVGEGESKIVRTLVCYFR